jgi:hypothetical protein
LLGVAGGVAIRPGLRKDGYLDNQHAWIARHSVCRRGASLGLTRLVAPWKVGYEPVSAAINRMVSGILVILFAACELMTGRDVITWRYDHWHHPFT